jgi:hypothetical protein
MNKMNDTLVKILAALSLIALLLSNNNYKKEIANLKAQLDDPEHCIEQCSMAFEIMGC